MKKSLSITELKAQNKRKLIKYIYSKISLSNIKFEEQPDTNEYVRKATLVAEHICSRTPFVRISFLWTAYKSLQKRNEMAATRQYNKMLSQARGIISLLEQLNLK